jgi:hypothetical protein
VDVLPVVAPAVSVITLLFARVMPGALITVTALVVDAVIFPVAASLPVIVTTYAPTVVFVVEFTVRVVVAGDVPVMSICVGMLQVMGLVAFDGADVTAQLRSTTPANPPTELAVTVAVLPVVLPALMLIGLVLSEKFTSDTNTFVVPVEVE